jgi:alkanesulfonate monooxygenase SsuD/methylene tetrahydromethanopterin reductase-like flavin-dependent oxidoreductase (luciferase family)
MDFGIFDHLDRGDLPLQEFYEARLKLIEAYDRAGFHAYHVAEHHSTPLGMAPSPSVFLAAVAQRTTRLRLGTLVYALPLHHPLRMIEEICMLDQMSGGRLDIGFGRGSSPIEVEYYGVDPATTPRLYWEALDTVLAGLTAKTLNVPGAAPAFAEVPMELAPLQQPHPPLWYGVHSTESAERAACKGFNIVCNEPAAPSRGYFDHYRATWREAHGAASPVPHIGVTQFVVVAESDAAALAAARPAYLKWHESFHYLWRRHGRSAQISGGEPDFDTLAARGKGVAGTPEKVAAFLRERLAATTANYCVARFAFGSLSLTDALRSVALFEQAVMPALR